MRTGAAEIAAFLRADPDRYADVTEREAFARAVTLDLYEMVNDAHLRVSYRPETPPEDTQAGAPSFGLRQRPGRA